MPSSIACVVGVGMACPLGLRSRPAIAAMDAGVVRFFEREDVITGDGSARASMLNGLGLPLVGRTERAAFLARHALAEALANVGAGRDNESRRALPCLLALPAPGVGPRIDPEELLTMLAHAQRGEGLPGRMRLHRVVEEGRAGIFQALDSAISLLKSEKARLVLVAGVDSLVDTATLIALSERNRLTSRTQLDGIVPGEGAAAILLSRADDASRLSAMAHLRANAVAREPMPFEGDQAIVSGSEGLSAVFRRLLMETGGRVDEVFAGTTSEVFFGRELSHAYLRNVALMPEPMHRRLLGTTLGDVGAAAGAISLVHAIVRLGPEGPGNRGDPNRLGLAYASSDNGLVGGCVVAAVTSSKGRNQPRE